MARHGPIQFTPITATRIETMQFLRLFTPVFLLLTFGVANSSCAQTRIIELQICSDDRAVIGTQQEWMEVLATVGADRVVVKTANNAKPAIEETKISGATLINVTGVIKNNRLQLPGGTFGIRDKAGIAALVKEIRDDGAAVALADKKAFGLTAPQLVELHTTLSKPLNFNTRGQSSGETIEKISELLGVDFQFDPPARRELRNAGEVKEELNGISAGTAIAVVVRPLGLVLQPDRKQGQSLELKIISAQVSTENWPIGWPVERPPVQIEPKLFERLALEIRGYPLLDTMNAIEKKTGVPFFYDQNTLARLGIEMSAVKVTLVQGKVSYMVAIGKLLRQSKPAMFEELRVDENGKPFLWISSR